MMIATCPCKGIRDLVSDFLCNARDRYGRFGGYGRTVEEDEDDLAAAFQVTAPRGCSR
jgi:hypothetical protein